MVIQPVFPPSADLKVDPEPAYPTEALVDGEEGSKAEAAWISKMLIWGRTHHDRVQRICRWAVELKAPVPPGTCP